MRVGVTPQQHRLKEDHARIPNRRPAAQQRQQHFGDHRLDPEQQRRAEEQSCREQRSHYAIVQGTITLLADCQFAVAINASLARSSGNRCVTVSAKGNTFEVACKNARATPRWRGSLDQEPNTWSCLRVITCGLNATVPASQ